MASGKRKASNYSGTRKTGDLSGSRTLRQARLADMRALEALPSAVRLALNDLNINLSAETVLGYYLSIARQARNLGGSLADAEVWTLRKLTTIEGDDLTRAGAPVEVSVLRYGATDRIARRRAHTLRIPT